MVRKIKFDGKHWVGKKYYNDPMILRDYETVFQQARYNLGTGGMIAIPNARPDDMRYEEFFDRVKEKTILAKGSAFHYEPLDIYVLKAQEITLQDFWRQSLTYLFYNLPPHVNISGNSNSELLETAQGLNAISGLVGPSCINGILEEIINESSEKKVYFLNNIISQLDFFIGYSGSAALKLTNRKSISFYRDLIGERGFTYFKNDEDIHTIGITAVSGGHRTPHKARYLGFKPTIGTSNITIPEPRTDYFMDDLRRSLRNAREEDCILRPIIGETLWHIASMGVADKVRKILNN